MSLTELDLKFQVLFVSLVIELSASNKLVGFVRWTMLRVSYFMLMAEWKLSKLELGYVSLSRVNYFVLVSYLCNLDPPNLNVSSLDWDVHELLASVGVNSMD